MPRLLLLRALGLILMLLTLLHSNDATDKHSTSTPPLPPQQQQPIFVMSLAKSGTTSVHKFFQCGGYSSVHHRHQRNILDEWGTKLLDRDLGSLVGKCIQQNLLTQNNRNGRSSSSLPLDNCGNYQVWSDLSYTTTDPDECFFPTHHKETLEELYQAYPAATWILTTRNETEWYRCISTFLGGKVLNKWNRCFRSGEEDHKTTSNQAYWTEFYTNHTARIDQFAKTHPSLRYIKVNLDALEDDNAANVLSEGFDIAPSCFNRHRKSRHPWNRMIDAIETKVLLWNQQ